MKTKCKAHWRVWINMVTGKEILMRKCKKHGVIEWK